MANDNQRPVKHNGLTLNVRLDENDAQLMLASADDAFISVHQHARAIIQTYLRGYKGPYVLRVPLEGTENE